MTGASFHNAPVFGTVMIPVQMAPSVADDRTKETVVPVLLLADRAQLEWAAAILTSGAHQRAAQYGLWQCLMEAETGQPPSTQSGRTILVTIALLPVDSRR